MGGPQAELHHQVDIILLYYCWVVGYIMSRICKWHNRHNSFRLRVLFTQGKWWLQKLSSRWRWLKKLKICQPLGRVPLPVRKACCTRTERKERKERKKKNIDELRDTKCFYKISGIWFLIEREQNTQNLVMGLGEWKVGNYSPSLTFETSLWPKIRLT